MAGDEKLRFLWLGPNDIGRRSKCPRCLEVGVIDDINQGDVIIRHDAETWHLIRFPEACAILWERLLRR